MSRLSPFVFSLLISTAVAFGLVNVNSSALAFGGPGLTVADLKGPDSKGPNLKAERRAARLLESPDAEAKGGTEATGSKTTDRQPELAQGGKQKWVRLKRNAKGSALAMQTAIVRYRPTSSKKNGSKNGSISDVHVDLIGAVHVGDRAYYNKLNRRFKEYDVLLYELVAPKGTVVEKGRGTSNAHPVGALQNGMKGILGLEHQLERIDYTAKNFVHADMSPSELSASMDKRGESFLQMYFRLIGAEMSRQSRSQAKGESAEFDMLFALFSPDRDRRFKIILAGQFENIESMLAGFNGPDGSTLITERNKVALKVLAEQLKAGKKRVGVFYGAGHLADMDARLRNEFHMVPVSVTWLDAWDLRP